MYVKIAAEIVPILFGVLLTGIFWSNNAFLALVYIFIITVLLKNKYQRGDVQALIIGFFVGLFVEIVGTYIIGYQSFANPDVFGIPIWLPIAWGYGFMAMKRIGVITHHTRKRKQTNHL